MPALEDVPHVDGDGGDGGDADAQCADHDDVHAHARHDRVDGDHHDGAGCGECGGHFDDRDCEHVECGHERHGAPDADCEDRPGGHVECGHHGDEDGAGEHGENVAHHGDAGGVGDVHGENAGHHGDDVDDRGGHGDVGDEGDGGVHGDGGDGANEVLAVVVDYLLWDSDAGAQRAAQYRNDKVCHSFDGRRTAT